MKHLVTKLVLFLLLGAVVNVAVAWGLSDTRMVNEDASVAVRTDPG